MRTTTKQLATLLPFILAALLLVAGCRQQSPEEAGQPEATPTQAAASTVDAAAEPGLPPPSGTTILADGQLVSVNPVLALGFETSGRLLEVLVRPGERVAAGTVVATLDDAALREAETNARIALAQAENSLAQAQLTLDELLNWEPDETAVALAEANLAAAEAALENAQTADAVAGNSLTSARVGLDQAERSLVDAQEAYETAFDPGREWELNDPFRSRAMEAEREAATRNLQLAQDNLEVARAQYNLAAGGINNDTAVSAEASLISAQQALEQATRGPKESEIQQAELNLEQARLSLEQAELSLAQAEAALEKATLILPWSGTVLSVDAAPGAFVGAGTPVLTLVDTEQLQFHTSNLSERDLTQIEPGQAVEIVLKGYPAETLAGTVAGIAPQAVGTVGDAAVFTVIINLEPTELLLRPGMTGRAEISN